MKQKFLAAAIISCLVIATIVFAQTGTNSGTKYQYCEFVWSYEWNTFSGQTVKRYGKINYHNGQEQAEIDSRVSGLNLLGAKGWELCTAYIEEGEGWQNTVYSFKKKL